jgi:hypothetical protein
MANGTPFHRQQIFMLKNGCAVLDWEQGLAQDILTGEFVPYTDADFSHGIQDYELDSLIRAARVERYDSQTVWIYNLPEPPRNTLE